MVEIDYPKLVQDYYNNLNENLRHFKGGPGFLETWVHDENHNRSLLEILDLAQSHGVSELLIKLSTEIRGEIDPEWLENQSRKMGSLIFSENGLHFFLLGSHK